ALAAVVAARRRARVVDRPRLRPRRAAGRIVRLHAFPDRSLRARGERVQAARAAPGLRQRSRGGHRRRVVRWRADAAGRAVGERGLRARERADAGRPRSPVPPGILGVARPDALLEQRPLTACAARLRVSTGADNLRWTTAMAGRALARTSEPR